MGTIREKLAYLNNTKSLIRNAIIDKGVPVSANDTFRSYAEKIGMIQGGSGTGSALNLGPYAEPVMSYAFENKAGSLPSFSTERPVFPEYKMPEDWWDIEAIIDADVDNYPAKMIVLYPGDAATISLTGANFYRVSDGTTYTASGTHTWDTTFDKVSAEGTRYRYVIYYYNSANGYSASSVGSNALAVITKGFKWTNSGVFRDRSYLQYIKTKDSDWSACTSTEYWCTEDRNLVYASFDWNNGNSWVEPIGSMSCMFYNCKNLAYTDFSYPAYVYDMYQTFYYCYDYNNVHFDFSYRDPGAVPLRFYRTWEGASPNGNAILSYNPNYDMNSYRPWIGIKTDHPLKVSSITLTNKYDGTLRYDEESGWSYADIEASNDGKNWEVVGRVNKVNTKEREDNTATLNLETAYQYWRFRSNSVSWFALNFIQFTAQWEKTTIADDGTETKEWVSWVQPTFSSNAQDDCVIACSSYKDNNASYAPYKAFQNKTTSGNYWRSEEYSYRTSSLGLRNLGFYDMCYYQDSYFNYFYVEGTDKTTYFDGRGLKARYVIFENTSSMTSFNSSFAQGSSSISSSLVGIVIPDASKVTDWNYAFQNCTSMTVAPQIELRDDATVYFMFQNAPISDFSFLSYSNLINPRGLFAGTSITQLKAEFPNAVNLDTLCEYCHSLVRADIVAPKARSFAYAFRMNTRSSISSQDRTYLERDPSNQLKYVRVSGYNLPENEVVTTAWSRPNLSSNTSYGTITSSGLSFYNSDTQPWRIFDGSVSSKYRSNYWYSSDRYQCVFKNTGSITWQLPAGVEPDITKITFIGGINYDYTQSYKVRLYADAEKTIPLTEEFTVDQTKYRDTHVFELETPVKMNTFVIDITENNASYGMISEIRFEGTVPVSGYMTNMNYMFHGSEAIRIDVDSSQAINMTSAFGYMPNLLDVPDISYDSAVNMNYAFQYCPGLTELNGVEFPVAENLSYAFSNCWGLVEVTDFSAPECTNANYMFQYCYELGAFIQPNMPKVTSMAYAFQFCDFLKDLDLSNIDSTVNCEYICYYDHALAKVKLPSKPTNLAYAFYYCYALRQANLGDTSLVSSMEYAFYNCKKLVSVNSLNLASCLSLYQVFYNCSWLETVDITNLDSLVGPHHYNNGQDDTLYYTYYYDAEWFKGCTSLTSISLPDMPKVQGLRNIFEDCTSLVDLTIGATPVCKSMYYLCRNCYSLKNASFADTSKVEHFTYVFGNCSSLEVQPSFSVAAARTLAYAFHGCSKLKAVDMEIPAALRLQYMFAYCYDLATVALNVTSAPTSTSYMFRACHSLSDISFTDNWNMTNNSDVSGMFYDCRFSTLTLDKWTFKSSSSLYAISAENPNLTSFTVDFGGVAHSGSKARMVWNCPKLVTFNIEHTANLSELQELYANTPFTSLTVNVADFTSGNCPTMYGMFRNCANLETVILNFSGRWMDRYSGENESYSYLRYLFAWCPKLKRVDIFNAGSIRNWDFAFRDMNPQQECIIDWNGSRMSIYSKWTRAFDYMYGVVKHVNMSTDEDNSGWFAFTPLKPAGYCAEPMLQEAQLNLKLPVSIQVQGFEVTTRTDEDLYQHPDYMRFYTDEACTNPMSPALTLAPAAGTKSTVEISDVVTDTIACKMSRESGRYVGIQQLDIKAKAKGANNWVTWNRPNLSSDTSYGTVTASGYNGSGNPYKAFDGTVGSTSYSWCTPNSTTGWLKWKLPHKIKIKGMSVVSCTYNNSSYYPFQGRFYTDETKTIPVGNSFSTTSYNQTRTISGIPEEGIITDCIYLEKTGGGSYSGPSEIRFSAEWLVGEYLPWESETQEWIEVEPWEPEAPTSSTAVGTIVASTSATDAEAYKAAAGTGSAWSSEATDADPYWQWELPTTVAASQIDFNSDVVKSCQLYSDEGNTVLGSVLTQREATIASGFAVATDGAVSIKNGEVPTITSSIECVTCFTAADIVENSWACLFYGSDPFGVYISPDTKALCWSCSWTSDFSGVTAIELNKTYWSKTVITTDTITQYLLPDFSKVYTVDTLPDISQWTVEFTSDIAGVFPDFSEWTYSYSLGFYPPAANIAVGNNYFRGSFDLAQTRVYVDGSVWFDGRDASSYAIGSGITVENTYSGFSYALTAADPADLSMLRIKPLSRFDDVAFGSDAVATLSDVKITGTYDAPKNNIVDFIMPYLSGYSTNDYEVTCTQPVRSRFTTTDSNYYSRYMFNHQYQKIVNFPAICGCNSVLQYVYRLDFDQDSASQPQVFENLDFHAITENNPSWVASGNWWQVSGSSYLRVMPTVIKNPRNINGSINMSQFTGLTHDSLIELLTALVSKVGVSACTLTLGAQNLAKLTDEEKAIATEKNWNLA